MRYIKWYLHRRWLLKSAINKSKDPMKLIYNLLMNNMLKLNTFEYADALKMAVKKNKNQTK